MKETFHINEKVIVIERSNTGEIYEWEGIVTQVNSAFVETKHSRNAVTHPQWMKYFRAYMDTWIKHYYGPNDKLINVKKITN